VKYVGGIVVVAVVAAAGYGIYETTKPKETIQFFVPETSSPEEEIYKEIFSKVSLEIPKTEFQLNVITEKYHETVLEVYESGKQVDVFYVDSPLAMLFIAGDALLPVKELVSEEYVERFYEFLLEPFRGSDRRIYALPARWSMLAMFYNRELFDEAGLDRPPETWKELVSQAEAITDTTAVPGLALFADRFDFYLAYALAEGVKQPSFLIPYDPDPPIKRADWFNRPEVRNSMSNWIDLYVKGNTERKAIGQRPYVATPTDVKATSLAEAFGSNKVAIITADSQTIPYLVKQFPSFEYEGHWDIAPLPAGAKARATMAYVLGIGVTPRTTDTSAAWALVESILSEEMQEKLLIKTGLALPSLKTLTSPQLVWPQHAKTLTQMSSYDVIMPWFTGRKHTELVPKLEEIMHSAMIKEISIETALDKMYERALDILTKPI